MVLDRHEVDRDAVGFQENRGAADRHLADAAVAEAAADGDLLRVRPVLGAQEPPCDRGEFLGEILGRTVDDAGGFGIAVEQRLVELLLGKLGLAAERVLVDAGEAVAPVLQDFGECLLRRAVADETILGAELEIVAVDADARQDARPVRASMSGGRGIGHWGSLRPGQERPLPIIRACGTGCASRAQAVPSLPLAILPAYRPSKPPGR